MSMWVVSIVVVVMVFALFLILKQRLEAKRAEYIERVGYLRIDVHLADCEFRSTNKTNGRNEPSLESHESVMAELRNDLVGLDLALITTSIYGNYREIDELIGSVTIKVRGIIRNTLFVKGKY